MRTQIDGPTLVLKPNVAQAMAVALHGLATNAAKYGALSMAKGHVRVEWSRAGGPRVNPRTRKGFGIGLIESMIGEGVKGRMRLDWHSEGLACEIILPT